MTSIKCYGLENGAQTYRLSMWDRDSGLGTRERKYFHFIFRGALEGVDGSVHNIRLLLLLEAKETKLLKIQEIIDVGN